MLHLLEMLDYAATIGAGGRSSLITNPLCNALLYAAKQ